ncbi:25S rRNA (adenine(645)-N(1))-methyltransferase [Theileria orientalis]|uniref:Ribosomal RNA-processing protein 8 n=1 Tax=Theileria orientalis TaxID=68886 RepID=A0A976MDS9_THEOR|nr:25S rRNA (adenine(645)-N(1))-methyltransferase [Theileria orientalis]
MTKKRKKNKFNKHKFDSRALDSYKESKNVVSKSFKPKSNKKHSMSEIKNRLSGSRFRFLNEQLYSSESEEAWNMFKSDPNLFNIYHEGYQNQVSNWPYNPVLKVISWLKDNKHYKSIGDFGCGEALIARSMPDRKVHSFDLVSTNEFVIACNILKVPLEDGVLDVAVFCLSLMGKDWPLFIVEATRCLKLGGVLKIVEVTSRLTNVKEFVKFINAYGYQANEYNYKKEDFFVTFEFILKTKRAMNKTTLVEKSELLSPCLYKIR